MAKDTELYLPDGSFDWSGGVDSSKTTTLKSALNPGGLGRNQLSWLYNGTVRGGGIIQRTGWQPLSDLIDAGRYQYGYIYEPEGANPYLVVQISGVLYSALLEPPFTITDLTGGNPSLRNPADTERAFFCQAEMFLVIQAGDALTLPLFWDGNTLRRSVGLINFNVPVPSVPGSPTVYVLGLPANLLLPFIAFAIPTIGTTTNVVLAAPYPGVIGDIGALGALGNFQIMGISGNIITIKNIDSPYGGQNVAATPAINFTVANNPGSTGGPFNEIPAALQMDYHHNQLWYAQGRQWAAGDQAGGPSGTPLLNYRDSVIHVTENPLILGGDSFTVPTNGGNIRALKHSANLNAALGEGPLYIYTRKVVYALRVPETRTDWINATATNQPQLTVVQLVNGSVNDISVVPVNGDLFYQSLEPAVRSLQVSVRNFGQWGNTPISQNEQRALQVNDRGLMRFSSGIHFDNRLWELVLPKIAGDGVNVIHQAVLPLDFDVVSNLNTQDEAEAMSPPVWEGAYDGIQFLQLFEGDFGGLHRAFATVISELDGSIDVWELTTSSRTDNGDNRVLWGFESPAFTWATSGLETNLKHLKGGELWVDKVFGTVNMDVYYRVDADPCWRPWFSTEFCAGRDCQEVEPVCIAPYPPPPFREGYKFPIVFPEPKPACDSMGVRPTTIGYQFQVKVIFKGWCRTKGLILYAMPHTEPQYHGIACPPGSATPQGMRRLPIIKTPLLSPTTPPSPPIPPPPPPTVSAPVNSSAPTISGTAQVGDTLSGTNGTWTNTPTGYTYRWLANGVAIGGATANTFLLTTAQLGEVITFEVTASNAGGSGSPATSSATGAVIPAVPAVPVNSVLPVITGTAQDGQILSGSDGTWTNSPTGYAYRWFANGVVIGGATSNNLLLTSAQVGTTITFEVTASNAGGNSAPATSSATGAVLPAVPVNSILPVITGTAQVGNTLSGSDGTWTNTPTSFTYVWLANGTPIGGATANTFLLTGAQLGQVITFRVTAANAGGSGSPATSAATSAVTTALNALATAWAAQVVTNGGAAPSGGTVTAISDFCDALDSASLTAKMISLNCFVPDGLIAAMTPLIHVSGSDPWVNNNFILGDLSVAGLAGDGASKSLTTGVLGTDFPSDADAGATLYGSVVANHPGTFELGYTNFSGSVALNMSLDTGAGNVTATEFNSATGQINTPTSGAGYYSMNRVAANDFRLYYAKSITAHGQIGATNVGAASSRFAGAVQVFSGQLVIDSTLLFGWSFCTLSFAAMHSGLSASESLALYNAVQALRTALGGGFV